MQLPQVTEWNVPLIATSLEHRTPPLGQTTTNRLIEKDIVLLRDKESIEHQGSASGPSAGAEGKQAQELSTLEKRLRMLHDEYGHGHPKALVVELELARLLYRLGDLDQARETFAQVLAYESLREGDHGLATAQVALDIFRLLCDQDDRSAMAEVYYRYLSWIPMRDPATLCSELQSVLREVEDLLARST